MTETKHTDSRPNLPDYYRTVAQDIVGYVDWKDGMWMDIGCGSGELGLAVASVCKGSMILLDPNEQALKEAVRKAVERGLRNRVVPVGGTAESIPFPSGTVDVVFSRGSIFFWKDRPAGVSEVYRVLRPGGRAMLGGGLGRAYPDWARREFIRRRCEGARKQGGNALRSFQEVRSRDTFQRWAEEAGLADFEVVGEPRLPENASNAPLGIWLRFQKRE